MGPLIAIQAIAVVGVAWLISPRTWIGASSSPHVHLIAAIVVGLLCTVPILLAVRLAAGTRQTRIMIAVAQMVIGAMLIHAGGGHLEFHFHVFCSLAILAVYRDVAVLLVGTLVVAADHLVRGIVIPESIFGTISAPSWLWAEHAGWVIALDAVLIYGIARSLRGVVQMVAATREAERLGANIRDAAHRFSDRLEDANRTGNLNQSFDAGSASELAPLAAGLTHFVNRLGTIVSDVDRSSDAVREAADSMSHKCSSASETAREQAASADGARQALETAAEDIAELSRSAEASRERIEELSRLGDAIVGAVDSIRSISFQTNLLALNAAVEAARAGSHGAGFAVVADEVRALATRSNDATAEISASIEAIKRSCHETSAELEAWSTRVGSVHETTDGARVRIDALVDEVRGVAEAMDGVLDVGHALHDSAANVLQSIAGLNGSR
ncbi:MAG: methyl-accepting chemotaxis protein [Phycisphaerales bacterium]